MLGLVETTPRLTLTALRKARVFATPAWVEVQLDGADQSIECRWSAQCEVELRWPRGRQLIALQWRKLRYGPAAYFERPDQGGLCSILYLAGDEFLNREALGLTYTSQLMSADERADLRIERVVGKLGGEGPRHGARGAVKTRLLNELRASPDRLSPDAWRHLDRDQAASYLRRRRRPLRSDPLVGTRWALLRGRTRPPQFASKSILWLLDQPDGDESTRLATTGLVTLEASPSKKGHMPELDIRALRPRKGFSRGHKLVWGDGEERLTLLTRIIGEGAQRRLQLMLHLHHGPAMEVVHQDIKLVAGQRAGDLFMLCPVTERRLLKAYFRGGRFASAQAQSLR